jgi:hypothetical protein
MALLASPDVGIRRPALLAVRGRKPEVSRNAADPIRSFGACRLNLSRVQPRHSKNSFGFARVGLKVAMRDKHNFGPGPPLPGDISGRARDRRL